MDRRAIAWRRGSQVGPKSGCRVAPRTRGTAPMENSALHIVATAAPIAEMDRLGDEIAKLSAHLDAAGAHLLELIREFDAREGWNTGFCSCAHWLNWRVGLDLGAARERVRVARALGALTVLDDSLRRGAVSYSKVRA